MSRVRRRGAVDAPSQGLEALADCVSEVPAALLGPVLGSVLLVQEARPRHLVGLHAAELGCYVEMDLK